MAEYLKKEWICPVCKAKNSLIEDDIQRCLNDIKAILICYQCSKHFEMIGLEALIVPEPLKGCF